ncbi:MFS transporter [Pseudoroseomonas cervicalis]|uniref:Transporter, major facilitator family protein n=1 Tax=Pseudoroseomonas cervicalis ATCC 49957 TaxID=525371 RepID=D5RMJ1_9PROT|nr:MFS transporter [Pseudoroseomonas cervicalis]EFH11477.1 transporter, major facilitator family protein [Pseudoroseomonas cervicalis ATCC 49957]
MPSSLTRKAVAWSLYDWANSAFPTVVSTFVIATYFTQGIAADPATGQAQWGWMQTLAGIAIALLSPVLGAVADAGGRRRAMLLLCTVVTSVATGLIWFATPGPGSALWALLCVGIATVGFELGTVFYNSMLPQVAPPERLGRVSGLAWGLGYAGGLACLVLCLVLLVRPDPSPLGLDRGAAEHVRATALLVAGWMLAFGWPVLLALPDPPPPRPRWGEAVRRGIEEIARVLRGLPRHPSMARFLLARLFYTDGLNTLFAFGAIYAAGRFGMGFEQILVFGIALNVTAGLGAAGFGLVEDRLGSRQTVLVALACMVALGTALVLTSDVAWFWGLALVMGLFMGPAQSASRSFMARLAPPAEVTAYFGLFALSGRITGFLGPAVLAIVTGATGSQQAGMATVLGFLALGGVILLTVRDRPIQ